METEAEQERGSKSGVFKRLAQEAGMPVVEVRAAQSTQQDLSGIPVMDEDDDLALTGFPFLDEPSQGIRPDELVTFQIRESAPVSARGRVALAKEMLLRVSSDLQAAWVETPSEQLSQARNCASEGLSWLEKLEAGE